MSKVLNHSLNTNKQGSFTMNQDQFERLNHLSEKSLNENATPQEMREFSQLLNDWNLSVELNLFSGLHNNIFKRD
jgi:hypothetical protein